MKQNSPTMQPGKFDIQKNRIEVFDIAKGIGILIMVMGHSGFGMDFNKVIHTFHMPLFFFISGYFYRPAKNRDFKRYLLHQINVLLVPYIVFAVFYEILHYIYVGEWSVAYFMKSLLSSNHNRIDVAGALWFLLTLFSAKILYNLLEHRMRNLVWLTVAVTVISFIANTLRRFDILLPLCLDSALSMLLVIHGGYLLYYFRDKGFLQKISRLKPVWLIAVTALFVLTAWLNDDVNIRRNRYGIEVLYMVSCFCGIVLTMNLSHLLSIPGGRILAGIRHTFAFWGRESIVFLLVNELFLFIVYEMLVAVGMSADILSHNYWASAMIVLGAMGMMSLVALLSRRKPLSYIFGKDKLFGR